MNDNGVIASDHELVLAIRDILDSGEWRQSMLSEIADLLTNYGYPLEQESTTRI